MPLPGIEVFIIYRTTVAASHSAKKNAGKLLLVFLHPEELIMRDLCHFLWSPS